MRGYRAKLILVVELIGSLSWLKKFISKGLYVFCLVCSVSLEQRLKALNQLMSVIKKCHSEELWNKHFKMVLLLLLETMRDASVSIV